MDTHARDALAAAVYAYRQHRDTIDEIRRKAAGAGLAEKTEAIIQQAFTDSRSLQQIIDAFRQDDEEDEVDEPQATPIDWEETAQSYRDQLRKKEKEIERLRSYIDDLKETNESLEAERDRLQDERATEAMQSEAVQRWKGRAEDRQKRIHKMENRVSELENSLERYRKALTYLKDGEDLYNICEDGDELAQVDDSIAFIRKNLQTEPPSGIRAVIVEKDEDMSFYEEHGVTAIDYRDLRGLKLDSFYIVDRGQVIDHIQQTSETFISWLEEYRERG